ncbi:hypothetical protein E2C01_004560 [Portunus trituberculatus]|uniref:Uncharacterized protein n=1 Tax=Portunus trituberculatus TaxID=210409 RepID=A0A5B7CRP6_PORTR|nr:hypothetical protein [Portunus trituberculatus]
MFVNDVESAEGNDAPSSHGEGRREAWRERLHPLPHDSQSLAHQTASRPRSGRPEKPELIITSTTLAGSASPQSSLFPLCSLSLHPVTGGTGPRWTGARSATRLTVSTLVAAGRGAAWAGKRKGETRGRISQGFSTAFSLLLHSSPGRDPKSLGEATAARVRALVPQAPGESQEIARIQRVITATV